MVNAAEQVVVVTGGNGGIGAALVAAYADLGATVINTDRGPEPTGNAAAYYDLDVTDEGAVTATLAEIVDRFGRIDVVVHAAGVLGDTVDPMETTTAEFERVMTINGTATFTVAREAGRIMRERGIRGSILLLSSVAAKEARTTYLPYNASKIAVLHITWSMAQILGPSGISVNAIAPGPTETRMWAQLADASGPDADRARRAREARAAQLPMGRFAQPEEIASAALFLTDPRNRYITGITLDVAGGAHLGMGS